MHPRILVVGSANQDLVFRCGRLPGPGETLLGGDMELHPGGKGANQAVAIGKLGGDVSFCGCVGSDIFGKALTSSLQEANVDLTHLRSIERPTGTACILVDEVGMNSIVVAPGANANVEPQDVARAIAGVNPEIVIAQLEIPIESVFSASKARRFLLNPAPARELPDELIANCEFITPNEHETFQLTGIIPCDEESCRNAAGTLLKRGAKNVVITLGDRGCFWMSDSASQFVAAPKVTVVDTTAAGDAFSGALVHFLAQGQPTARALQSANAVAALSVSRSGAQPSMPDASQLASFMLKAEY